MTEDLWIRLIGQTPENLQLLKDKGIDLAMLEDMEEDDNYLYLPLRVMVRGPHEIPRRRSLVIIMGKEQLITVQDGEVFPPLDKALWRMRRRPETLRSPQTLLCLILQMLNDHAGRIMASIGNAVEESADTISEITRSLNSGEGTLGVTDINDTIIEINEREILVARCLESQLALARAARYLDMEVAPTDELQIYVRSLRDDIAGVKEHAAFEHESVRYLQNAILASLNVKQNQIVKVFTILTAVFLPPTLIASIYGMNFAVMPELKWPLGFPVAILLGLMAALMPLVYVKRRGWLR